MKLKSLLFTLFLACIFLAGCTQKMYYFGNYSNTLYAFTKNQDEESLIRHKQELEHIITESQIQKLPVPPGIYAELGYINLKAGRNNEAIRLFQSEVQVYPESVYFMDNLIKSAKEKENPENTLSQ
jgi:hypothetical protein